MACNVFKYKIPRPDSMGLSTISLPFGARPLSIGMQGDSMVLWALVEGRTSPVPRTFYVVNTGREIPEHDYTLTFIGTVTSSAGIVWHVFEVSR